MPQFLKRNIKKNYIYIHIYINKCISDKSSCKNDHRCPHSKMFEQTRWLAMLKVRKKSDSRCCEKIYCRKRLSSVPSQASLFKQNRTMSDHGLRVHEKHMVYTLEHFWSCTSSSTLPLGLWIRRETQREIKIHCLPGDKLIQIYNRNLLLGLFLLGLWFSSLWHW